MVVLVFLCIIDVRLVGGDFDWEGRVEVKYNGEWGTICDDNWDKNDAHVVCRSLGFHSAASEAPWAIFGQGSGNIVLDDVQCAGTEDSLLNCPRRELGVHDCNHYEDAGVRCRGEKYRICEIVMMISTYIYNNRKNCIHESCNKNTLA